MIKLYKIEFLHYGCRSNLKEVQSWQVCIHRGGGQNNGNNVNFRCFVEYPKKYYVDFSWGREKHICRYIFLFIIYFKITFLSMYFKNWTLFSNSCIGFGSIILWRSTDLLQFEVTHGTIKQERQILKKKISSHRP